MPSLTFVCNFELPAKRPSWMKLTNKICAHELIANKICAHELMNSSQAIGARASAEPQASVLNPTRELASQNAQVIKTLGICTMKMMMMMIELILCCAAQYSRLALDKRYWITSSGIVGVHCFVIDHVFFVQCMRHRC